MTNLTVTKIIPMHIAAKPTETNPSFAKMNRNSPISVIVNTIQLFIVRLIDRDINN